MSLSSLALSSRTTHIGWKSNGFDVLNSVVSSYPQNYNQLRGIDLLMGLFDMFKKAFGMDVDEGKEQEQIQQHISMAFGDKIQGLNIKFEDETVTIAGEADSVATKQKAVLMAGNVKGVEAVNDMLTVAEPKLRHYTIQSGDSLSKIAGEVYGDVHKWNALFEANREVIKDPDLIYPGQIILIPEM